jgi:hypothetical protein
MFGDVVHALDETRDAFERIQPGLQWSAAQWSAASMAFRMRLPCTERHLAVLHRVTPANWPDTGWSIDLSSARADFEQELRAAMNVFDLLLRRDLPSGERAWQAQGFTSGGKGLLEALQRLREVIVTRYPEAIWRL